MKVRVLTRDSKEEIKPSEEELEAYYRENLTHIINLGWDILRYLCCLIAIIKKTGVL